MPQQDDKSRHGKKNDNMPPEQFKVPQSGHDNAKPRPLDAELTDETGRRPPKGKPDQQEYLDIDLDRRPGEPPRDR